MFDSHAVSRERSRRDASLQVFNAHLAELRKQIPEGFPDLNASRDKIDSTMTSMIAEAELIFTLFEAGRSNEAGSCMATMDRIYAQLTGAVNEAAGKIQRIQKVNFSQQLDVAKGFRSFEYLIGGLVLAMVGCVAFYGHHIGRVMRNSQEERETLLAALAERERFATSRLNDAMETLNEGIAFYGPDDRLQMTNQRYQASYGANGIAGMSFGEVTHQELAAGKFCDALGCEQEWLNNRLRHHRESNADMRVDLGGGKWARIYDRRTSDGGTVVLSFDITEKIEDEHRLEYMAHHDALTGLPNRTTFFDIVNQHLNRRNIRAGIEKAAVHYVDLDHFKRINDTLGHDAGDHVLIEVARRLKTVAGANAQACRLGGDEFAVVQLANDDQQVLELADSILSSLKPPIEWGGKELNVKASVGLAQSGEGINDAIALTKRADLALYAVKESGRSSVRQFDAQINKQHERRLKVETAVLAASDERSFKLHYQPVLELANGRLRGFEALLRLPHDGGFIPPMEFIPIAEDLGKIEEIGAWSLIEACSRAATWPDPVTVSVNLSALQFRSGKLIEHVRSALQESRLPPHRLELEITETLFLEDSQEVQDQLLGLKELGAKIALDDFGTGYSALNYLWKFPLDKIKIDRSFIQALEKNNSAKGVLSVIIGLGRNLHLPIVAEGVEKEAQRAFLQDLGCDLAQGYLFSKPVDELELPMMILHDFTESQLPKELAGSALKTPIRPGKRA